MTKEEMNKINNLIKKITFHKEKLAIKTKDKYIMCIPITSIIDEWNKFIKNIKD